MCDWLKLNYSADNGVASVFPLTQCEPHKEMDLASIKQKITSQDQLIAGL